VARSRLGSPAGTRGTMMQDKPNYPKRGTEAVSRSRPADRIPSIPLFYHSTIPVRCRWCETNPISGSQWADAGAGCTNKPNLRRCRVGQGHRDECAKQSQFRAVPNGPGLGDEGRGGQSCQTKPNLGRMEDLGDGISGTHIVPNKPNSARLRPPSGAKCVKETQFWSGHVGQAARREVLGLSRQTKPIPGEAGFVGPCLAGGRLFVRNKPNSARHPGRSGPFVSNEPNPARRGEHAKQTQSASAGPPLATECAKQTQSDPGGFCRGRQTKPIQRGLDRCASPMQERDYDGLDAPMATGKQSQFPGRQPGPSVPNKANSRGGTVSGKRTRDSWQG
jgi:hypothetical protein